MNIELKNILSNNKELNELLENDPAIKEIKTELGKTIIKNIFHNNKELLNNDSNIKEITNTEITNTEITNTEITNTEIINTEIINTEIINTEIINTEIINIYTTNIVNYENDKSYKKYEELVKNESFINSLIKSYSNCYSIKDSIKLFNIDDMRCSFVEKLDVILEEIEMKDELAEYIVEIELLREELLNRDKINNKLLPMMNKFTHYCVAYFLKILSYGNINYFYEYYQISKELDENGNKPMIIVLLKQILQTLIMLGMICYSICIQSGNIPELTWDDRVNFEVDERGQRFFSKQVYIEFNEYLTEKGFFENQPIKKPELCIIS